jgi:ABC-2 type transport system ATP-binding protein
MALAQSPKILILDEPTLGLDVVAKQSFLEAVMFCGTQANSTIIYCSHQMEEVERVADRLIIMEKGQLSNNSAPEDFVARVSAWIGDFSKADFSNPCFKGLLNRKKIDELEIITLIDREQNEVQESLERAGMSNIQQQSVSLDQAVNAFLTKHHASPKALQSL